MNARVHAYSADQVLGIVPKMSREPSPDRLAYSGATRASSKCRESSTPRREYRANGLRNAC